MSKPDKHLCDWQKKEIREAIEELRKNPQFICKECARVAGKKKWLCKPVPLLKQ